MRRAFGLSILLIACRPAAAPTSSPPQPLPPQEPATQPEPPTPAPAPAPAAQTDAPPVEPAPPTEPLAEPKPFNDQELARIRAVQKHIAKASAQYDVEPDLLNAVIWVESKFHARARGPAGARGLMQLMPRTSASLAKKLGRKHRPYDPEFNVHAGALYLSRLLAKFDGDERLALAGYSRGSGRIRALVEAGEPLPEGTLRFIERVSRAKARFRSTSVQ